MASESESRSQPDAIVEWLERSCGLDDGPAAKAAIGLIVMANDQSIELELRAFLPDTGVGLYVNRIPFPAKVSIEAAHAMKERIADVAAMIVPDDHLDVIAFGTTGGTMAIGEKDVLERLRQGRPGTACTTPITAAVAGLRTLGARRLAVITPYPIEINKTVIHEFITGRGFEIVAAATFNLDGDREYSRVPPDAIERVAIDLDRSDADAIFVSCTALRVSPVLVGIERALKKPVVTSNQALAWHCLRLAGYTDPVPDRGKLMLH